MLSKSQTKWLLETLCVNHGFCLKPADHERLLNDPPTDVDAFVDAVFRSEGLEASSSTRDLVTAVRDAVARAFDRAARSAHRYSRGSRKQVLASRLCGCFYCCSIYAADEIAEWIDEDENGEGQTALCPRCGVDSVIGDASGVPITPALLDSMRKTWF